MTIKKGTPMKLSAAAGTSEEQITLASIRRDGGMQHAYTVTAPRGSRNYVLCYLFSSSIACGLPMFTATIAGDDV